MSVPSLVVFLFLVAFVGGAFIAGVRHVEPRWTGYALLGLAAWLGAAAALAASGVLARFNTLPPPALIALVGFTAATLALAFSPLGRRLALEPPLWALVGVQTFRVPLEVLLYRLHGEGVLPVQVTYAGWNYDIATGLLAAALAVALWRRPVSRPVVVAWNGIGLLLLGVVVATAVLSLPTPFRRFPGEPSTEVVLTAPLIWLPTVLVQAALLGHLLVARRLRPEASAPEAVPAARLGA